MRARVALTRPSFPCLAPVIISFFYSRFYIFFSLAVLFYVLLLLFFFSMLLHSRFLSMHLCHIDINSCKTETNIANFEGFSFLGHNAAWSGESQHKFRKNMSRSSSGLKSRPSNQSSNCCLFHDGFLLGLLLNAEDSGGMFL